MSDKLRSTIKIVFWVALAITYYIFLYNKFLLCEFNSDSANFVLEGNDILHGNIFLSGWNLTGISFIATDLVFYTIAALFVGVSAENAVIATSLVFFLLTIICFVLISDKKSNKNNIWGYLLFLAIAAFPCGFLMYWGRYHTACIVESLFALYILDKYSEKNSKRKNILYIISAAVLMTLSAQSDADSILMIIGAVILTSGWKLIYDYVSTGKIEKKYLVHFLVSSVSIVASFVTDKLFYVIGGANKNSFLDGKSFISLEEYIDNINIYIGSVLALFNAEYPGKQLFSVDTVFYMIRVLFIILTMIFIVYNIICWIKQKKTDYLTAVLSIGVALISIVFIITNIAVDIGGGRYIGAFPALFSVIFVRTIAGFNIKWDKLHGLLAGKVIVAIIAVALMFKAVVPLPTGEIYHAEKQEALADSLEKNGLTNGYASFWNASSTTVISNNRVKVRATIGAPEKIEMFNWFCKNEWYEQPANFVVVEDDDIFGMTYDNMVKVLGEPSEVINVIDTLKILKYDYDITSRFDNGLSDNILYGSEWSGNETSSVEDGDRNLYAGGWIWGPYSPLNAGEYTVLCEGVNLADAEVDVFSCTYGSIMNLQTIGEDNFFEFTLNEDVDDIEIRVFNNTDETVQIHKFIVNKK